MQNHTILSAANNALQQLGL